MQLSFDAADRLVELVEARGGSVAAGEAARSLFALASAPAAASVPLNRRNSRRSIPGVSGRALVSFGFIVISLTGGT